MATSDSMPPYVPPPIQNRAPKPAGVLPDNMQGWVIAGIALLMVILIWLTGRNSPKGRSELTGPTTGVLDPNDARIRDFRTRIDDQARKLAAEQAKLAQTQHGLGVPPGAAAGATYPGSGAATAGGSAYTAGEREDNWIAADQAKRVYLSRYASNVALSYRPEPVSQRSETTPSGAPDTAKTASDLATVLAALRPAQSPSATNSPTPTSDPTKATRATTSTDEADDPVESRDRKGSAELNRATGKTYRVFEGTVIETALTNRLDGSFSGPVNCLVTTHLYSHDGHHLLIPQGSRVLGEVRKVQTLGQQRLAVTFHRLIMPDGYVVSLDKLPGLSQVGETGLLDQVNHHYPQVFGVSLAIGAIAGLSQANTAYGVNATPADAYRQGVAGSLSQSSLNILDRYLNVLPTFTIREGQRVKVYLTDDLSLPAYSAHQMAGDL